MLPSGTAHRMAVSPNTPIQPFSKAIWRFLLVICPIPIMFTKELKVLEGSGLVSPSATISLVRIYSILTFPSLTTSLIQCHLDFDIFDSVELHCPRSGSFYA